MAEVASSSSSDESSNVLAFRDCLAGTRVLLYLVPDGILQSPKQLLEPIISQINFFKRQKSFFAIHRRQQALPPIGSLVAECSPCARVRLMLPCVAFACQILATAPADTHMVNRKWSWAEVVMERVTRGRVKKVQVRLQRCAALVVPVLECAVCLTRAAGNAGWFSGPLLRIAAAASSAPRRSFFCAGCCCRPRCRRTRRFGVGRKWRRRFSALPCDC